MHVREIPALVAPGTSSVRACSRTSRRIDRAASASALLPTVYVLLSPPVAGGADDDVRDHGSPTQPARTGDVDRTATSAVLEPERRPQTNSIGPRYCAVDWASLCRARHRRRRLLAEPAKLIAGASRAVPVLTSLIPGAFVRRRRRQRALPPRRASIRGDTDARARHRRDGGSFSMCPATGSRSMPNPRSPNPALVRGRQFLRNGRFVQHDDERPFTVAAEDERRGRSSASSRRDG